MLEQRQHVGGVLVDRLRRRLLGKREHGDQRQVGDVADGADRELQLVEPEERLEDEEVGAAAGEHGRLLGVGDGDGAAALVLVHVEDAGERADRAGDERVDAGDLARLAGELDAGGVDRVDELAGPDALEARARGGEGGGLEQLGAGLEVGEVDVEHLARVLHRGEVEVGPGRQAGEQLGAGRAVGDDDVVREALEDARVLHRPHCSDSMSGGRAPGATGSFAAPASRAPLRMTAVMQGLPWSQARVIAFLGRVRERPFLRGHPRK